MSRGNVCYIHAMSRKRVGLIVVPPGVFVDIHEKRTVDLLATKLGLDITFIMPNRQRGAKTPDIEMNGLAWEIKCPKGKSSRTLENNLRLALQQSPYIIIDLRRMDGRIPTAKLLQEIERRFSDAKTIRHIIAITRQEVLVDYRR